jgi:hypothetical protein
MGRLFEGVCVGRRYELAGIAIHDFHVFVVEKLETLVCAGLGQIPRKLRHLAAIGHEAQGNAPLALDRHDVVQIENLAIGHQVQGVSLRDPCFGSSRPRSSILACIFFPHGCRWVSMIAWRFKLTISCAFAKCRLKRGHLSSRRDGVTIVRIRNAASFGKYLGRERATR